jgi:hypothetical protein
MPTLRELSARLEKYEPFQDTWTELHGEERVEVTGVRKAFREVDNLADADGICFLCPKCFVDNHGSVGTHSVICWFAGRVPDDLDPRPGRWNPAGTGIDDLTFVGPGAASVLLTGGCGWHGFVKDGRAE